MQMWLELLAIAESISFTDDCGVIIWSFDASGMFSVQTMYKNISFRGVQPLFKPAVWKIKVPPCIHIFL